MKKEALCTVIGAIGGAISSALGGWDNSIKTLVIFMILDYLSGFIVAGVFKNSNKTETGALNSSAGWKGLCKKFMTLVIVLISKRLEIALGTQYIRDAVVIAFSTNEALSIVENAGLMGIPIPRVAKRAIEVLKEKGETAER